MTNLRRFHDIARDCHHYVDCMKWSRFLHDESGRKTLPLVLCIAVLTCGAKSVSAQYTPLISGGAGFFTSTNGGNTSYIPTISPVFMLPIRDKVLIESKANLLENVFPRSHTGYDTQHFAGLAYLQADLLAGPHVTITPGYFYTPFNTFIERLSPIWVNDFGDGPLISTVGVGGGSSLGSMVRGNAYQNDKVSVAYSAYYSARSSVEQFSATRSSGGRLSLYSPRTGVELGASFNRRLQGKHSNNTGLYLWWTPASSRFRFRSEYAHAAHAQGYWFETGYPVTENGAQRSLMSRFEPLFRWQQTFRSAPDSTDGLPSVNTQRADFGLNYTLPHELRLKTSYSRRFSSQGNTNIWQTSLVYRFLFPAWRSR